MIKRVNIEVLECEDCGHQWIPRLDIPKRCPDCGVWADRKGRGKVGNPNFRPKSHPTPDVVRPESQEVRQQ